MVKAKIDVVRWGDRARVYKEGRNVRGMELDLLAVNSEANLEAAIKAINDAARGYRILSTYNRSLCERGGGISLAGGDRPEDQCLLAWQSQDILQLSISLQSGHDLDADPKRAFGAYNSGRISRSSSRLRQWRGGNKPKNDRWIFAGYTYFLDMDLTENSRL